MRGKQLFWVQLKTLIWKNFALKRRNWIFFLLELISPLVLFFIIVIVRLKRPPIDRPACHLKPKALPSAGFFPFLQTFVCGINNECYEYPPEADRESSLSGDFINAYISLFADDDFTDTIDWVVQSGAIELLQPGGLFNLDDDSITLSNETRDALDNSLLNITNFFLGENGLGTGEDSIIVFINAALTPLRDFKLCTGDQLTNNVIFTRAADNRTLVSEELCALSNGDQEKLVQPVNEVADYFNPISAITNLLRLYGALERYNILDLTTSAFQDIQSTAGSFQTGGGRDFMQSNSLDSLLTFTCGRSSSLTGLLSVGSVEETAESLGVSFGANNYKNDEEFSETCNALFESLESSVVSRTVWDYIKPIFLGKVYYSPDTPASNRIMAAFNQTFQEVGELFSLINLVELSRDQIFTQLYEYFENSNVGGDIATSIPFLDTIITIAPIFYDFPTNFNVTPQVFFSNDRPIGDQRFVTWQDLFNSTFEAIAMASQYFQCVPTNRLQAFESEDILIETGSDLLKQGKVWAGIVFTNIDPASTSDTVPPHLKYKVRMNTDKVDSTDSIIDRVWFPDPRTNFLNDLKAYTSGQVFVMDLLEKAVIKVQSGNSKYFTETGTWLKQFPSPCYKEDQFLWAISRTIPLFMVLAWLFSVGMIVKGIVYEKETRLKEVMKIMGLGNSILWLSWFLSTFIMLFTASILLSLILKLGTVLANSNFFLTCFMFVSFTFPTITFCFFVSTLFSKANLASACAGIAFFCAYLPYTLFLTWERYITSNAIKYALCLSSNAAFGFACSYFAYFEQQGTGVQWDNINTSPNYKDNFSLLEVIFMMYLDAVIYLLLALYIEQVFPGAYGVPKKWYFVFQKSFWIGESNEVTVEDAKLHFDPTFSVKGPSFEVEEVSGEKIGVQLRDMTKIYPTGKKLAVDQLSMNFYENQITSFLGHNGAGKTTTLSIITGLFSPTSGTAFVNGLDIRKHMDEIRRSVGMCPQYNVLFDRMTVAEHLYFYGKLRGRGNDDIKRDTIKLLKDLNLPHKSDEYAENLSGGMKRKLSVAVSFVGGNKTVILDEPTAGVDPFSRRGIWELLSKYKEGRTIILSTHHMDEADVLGDRIAIIANGKLQCSGSSLFLRRHFGDGYLLTIAKKQIEKTDDAEHSNSAIDSIRIDKDIENFVTANFSGASILKSIGQELTFVLPYSGLESGSFNILFEKLEKDATKLEISDYGLSDTSLEEIFIKVADQAPEHAGDGGDGVVPTVRTSFRKSRKPLTNEQAENKGLVNGDFTDNDTDNDLDNDTDLDQVKFKQPNSIGTGCMNGNADEAVVRFKQADRVEAKDFAQLNVPKVQGAKLLWLQFRALYTKRFHHLRKDKKAFLTQILLPAGFVFLAMFSSMLAPDSVDQPSLELQPWIYGDNHWMFYSDSSGNDDHVKRAISEFLSKRPHHSTRCVKGYEIDEHPCYPTIEAASFSSEVSSSILNSFNPDSESPSPQCSCKTGHSVCPAFAGGPQPAEKQLATTDKLQDLTDRNISDYLVKTRLEYRLQRFYGFEFEGAESDFNLTQTQILNTVDSIYNLLDSQGFFEGINNTYNSGLSWKYVMDELRDLINASVAPNNVKVWWNNKAHHGMLSSVNAMHNVLLRSSLPDSVSPNDKARYGITAYSHPWSLTKDQLQEEVLRRSGRDIVVGICVIFAMSFVPASFILYLIDERVSKSKHLQYVSGVNPGIFWLSTAAWDFTNYLVPALLCILIFLVFQAEAYVSSNNLPCLILLLILYGVSVTPLMYPACYIFGIPSTAYVLLTGINAFIGINATVATYILDFFPSDEDLNLWNSVLKKVFLIFPQFCLGRGLFEMALNQILADQLGQFGEYEFQSPLNFDIAGKHIFAMAVQSVGFFMLVLLIEPVSWLIINLLAVDRKPSSVDVEYEEDVNSERSRVLSGASDNDPVVVKRLRKKYGRKFVAVKDLCFSVPPGECFGLLGVNGAGKTTTFNILTGDDIASSGVAIIGGHDIGTELNSARKKVGFCPQFDALDPLLTVREHVALYARLRGIQNQDVAQVADGCIVKMGLSKYRNKQCGTLSGGNKRKLSTAIALVGDPLIIFLDEPTSGMDPKARRYLWQCIHDAISEGRSVVLTSHSMEECEALCTRLAIMVNGQFKCLGTSQHIKTKYGDGYVIQLKMPNGCCEQVEEFFCSHFPTAKIMEKLPTLVVFQLGQMEAKLGDLFRVIEKGKKTKIQIPVYTGRRELQMLQCELIEDYSVSQTTLDQVFINFAKNQSDIVPLGNQVSADNNESFEISLTKPRLAAQGGSMPSLITDVEANARSSNHNTPQAKKYLVSSPIPANDVEAQLNDTFQESQILLPEYQVVDTPASVSIADNSATAQKPPAVIVSQVMPLAPTADVPGEKQVKTEEIKDDVKDHAIDEKDEPKSTTVAGGAANVNADDPSSSNNVSVEATDSSPPQEVSDKDSLGTSNSGEDEHVNNN